jgi:glycerol-3-phosphate acyltransferase PlsY
MLLDLVFVMGAYLFGSVSSAVVTCRLMGLPDPRSQGSGNPGATNVLRTGTRSAAAITLLGDVLKGLAPVVLADWAGVGAPVLGAVAAAAVVGHMYPVFFGFKGGKGVATTLGVLLGLSWVLGALWGVTWLVVAALTRYSSLSALVATGLTPLYSYWLVKTPALVATTLVIAVLVIWRHRSNISNLLHGRESRIGQRL